MPQWWHTKRDREALFSSDVRFCRGVTYFGIVFPDLLTARCIAMKNFHAHQLKWPDQVIPIKWPLSWHFEDVFREFDWPLMDVFATRPKAKLPSYGFLLWQAV